MKKSTNGIRVPELAIGLAIVIACVLGALVWGGRASAGDHRVLVASRDLTRGEVITEDDLGIVEISASEDLAVIDASLAAQVVGLRAVTDVSAGAPLTEGQLGRRPMLASGEGLVGIVVTSAQAPAELAPGDVVDVVAVSRESDGGASRDRVAESMEVWAVTEADPMTGDRSVSLRIDRGTAPDIVGHDEIHLVKVGQS